MTLEKPPWGKPVREIDILWRSESKFYNKEICKGT
jgi:hypothetical protein